MKVRGKIGGVMPKKSKLELPPLSLGAETNGQRLARIRKARGWTQVELAEKMGLIQALVSDYERDKLRLNAEMAVRFALALSVTTDELLGLTGQEPPREALPPRRKLLRRLEQIALLPAHEQAVLLKTIDTFLKGAQKAA
jgi:transcriptional regulator with XRE-family HTH domain